MYKTILLPHDESDIADEAIIHAAYFGKQSQAKIILLNIFDAIDTEIAFSPSSMVSPYVGGSVIEDTSKSKEKVKKRLEKVKEQLTNSGVKDVEVVVVEGKAKEGILGAAQKYDVDLIIMTTNGRKGLGRVLMGSVADHVVKNAQCPVLVIKAKKIITA